MSDDFGKWWPCLKKHYKRSRIWLPHARMVAGSIHGARQFRYFTLCARPMIDVFMLVREKLLEYDASNRRVYGVRFCECDDSIYPEMLELVGVEESGFAGKLEDIVLFSDDNDTIELTTISDIDARISEVGLKDRARASRIEEKRRHLEFQSLFPFDFLNIDFCDSYYQEPPDVLKIHRAIERILQWQRRTGETESGSEVSSEMFVAAITCRLDEEIAQEAWSRLVSIVRDNAQNNPSYRKRLEDSGRSDVQAWANRDRLDFFMAAWPKDVARIARDLDWDIEILDHVYYERKGDTGNTYYMICLVIKFSRTRKNNTYLAAVEKCLEPASRTKIETINPDSDKGKALIGDLREIVEMRNLQAASKERPPIPDPATEFASLLTRGVPLLYP